MKLKLIIIILIFSLQGQAQELFSATEPASNKPARSITIRVDNSIMDETGTAKINYHLIPEIMVGISNKTMISADVFF